jgi:hypothetical protein
LQLGCCISDAFSVFLLHILFLSNRWKGGLYSSTIPLCWFVGVIWIHSNLFIRRLSLIWFIAKQNKAVNLYIFENI